MAKLNIRLLGPFQAELDGHTLGDFRSNKVRGLLAFLAVESQRPWSRPYLADLFWSDYPEGKAQSNLSNALWNLRAVIGDIKEATEFIIFEKSTLQFNPEADYWLDVKTFYNLIDKSRKAKSPENKSFLSELEEALFLSKGDFMEGFSIDNPAFETWLVKTRQEIHRKRIEALRWISLAYTQSGKLSKALDFALKWVDEEPWDERACRVTMQILLKLGQRKNAIEQFEQCHNRLAEDLGIAPEQETLQLYQNIIHDHPISNHEQTSTPPIKEAKKKSIDSGPLPENLILAAQKSFGRKPFFGRQEELLKLNHWLEDTLKNKGIAASIIGEPGSGKTYLLTEFVQQALQKHPDLLLLWGRCNAYTGQGDPYFPFMTMVKMLAGNIETLIPGPIISNEHLKRLWRNLPAMFDALINFGPDLAKQFLGENPHFSLAETHPGITQADLDLIRTLKKTSPKKGERQTALNDQFCQVVSALAEDHPILLVLDDLQWIDRGSTSLLFHLGRQLAGKKIFLLGAFRPSEVTITRDEKPHPLVGILQELRTIYGDNLINLAESEGHLFISELLSSEPNAFTASFQQKLYQHTSGHPLFSIELLRGMQLRNEIIKDKRGKWVASDHLNWGKLPARVEAVIARRFSLLPAECQTLMNFACVQGDIFSIEILARVFTKPQNKIFNLLNEEVYKRHQLITPQGIEQIGSKQVIFFRFRHALFQIYLYNQLDQVAKKRLHGSIGEEIENLYENHLNQYPEFVHTLARHFEKADQYIKSINYFLQAGKNAVRLTAHQDAIQHFYHALGLIDQIPESTQRDEFELDLQLSLGPPLTALRGWGAPELEKAYDRAQKLCENINDPTRLIPALWLLATFRLGRSEHKEVDLLVARLEVLVRQINETALMAMVYLQVSPLYQGRLMEARRILERAAAVDDIKLQRHLTHRFGMAPAAIALCYLSNCLWLLGYPDQADQIDQKACDMAEKIDHPMTTCYVSSRSCWLGLLDGDPGQVSIQAERLYLVAHKYGFKNFEFAALFFKNWLKSQSHEDHKLALNAMQKNIEAYYVTKTVLNRTGFLVFFSQACLEAGEKKRGLDAINQSLQLGKKTGEQWFQAEAWRVKGELLLINKGDRQANKVLQSEALDCFRNAFRIAGEQKAKMWELRAAMSLAEFYKSQNQSDEARKLLNDTFQWFTEGFEKKDLKKAQDLLNSL